MDCHRYSTLMAYNYCNQVLVSLVPLGYETDKYLGTATACYKHRMSFPTSILAPASGCATHAAALQCDTVRGVCNPDRLFMLSATS